MVAGHRAWCLPLGAFSRLGVLINLGARVGKFNPEGTAKASAGHSMPAALVAGARHEKAAYRKAK